LRCYKRKSVKVGICRRKWVTLSADFRRKVTSPTNHCQSSRVIALLCGIKISAVHHLVVTIHTCYSRTDRENYDSQDHACIDTRVVVIGYWRLKVQEVRYVVPKFRELWSINSLQWDCHFYPPTVNSAFYFITRLCTWRSANGTQPNFCVSAGFFVRGISDVS